jgi:hypothetical protein
MAEFMQQRKFAMRLGWIDRDANWFARTNIKAKSTEISDAPRQSHWDTWQFPVTMHPIDRRDNVAQIVIDDP